jgi:FixJ family two-component response regulator
MNPRFPELPCVLLVEDDEALRLQISRSLVEAGYAVHAFAGVDAVDPHVVPSGQACVAVLDMRLGPASGIDALRVLRKARPELQAVFVSGESLPQEIIEGMKMGVVEFLLKPFSLSSLLDAVRRGAEADRRRLERDEHRVRARQQFSRLTPREAQVCHLLVYGYKTSEVAEELGLAQGTAKIHRQRILDKLHVSSISEVIALLKAAGLVDIHLPPPTDAEDG